MLAAGLIRALQVPEYPTLRDVFEACKGKVNLNLDLKYRDPEEGFEERVIALIKEYDMDWQCVISSKSLLCLEKVKELDPDIRTGLIVHQLYKGLSSKETIDFISMKSSLITKNVVRELHRNGKELFVWTVNNRQELERLKRLGVDNIITDNPAYAKEVLFQSDQDPYFMTLFRIMIE
jgi:Glycerophosphoryl diester phosphodiesterase